MLEQLQKWDQELFCTLHNFRADWLDTPMVWITGKWTWLPLYAFLIAFLIWEYRQEIWRILILIALLITATDRFTSGFMKPYFARPRPCHEEDLTCAIDLVTGGCGGKFGFASSHAANVFGITMLLVLLWRKKSRAVQGLWLWAILVSYSRVYVGVHYFGDIFVGAIVGILLGYLAFLIRPLHRLPHRSREV